MKQHKKLTQAIQKARDHGEWRRAQRCLLDTMKVAEG